MRHIRKPVTLTPEKAEKLYRAGHAVVELAEIAHDHDVVPIQLLTILGEQFLDGFEGVELNFEN